MGWYKAVVFGIIPLSILLTVALIIGTIDLLAGSIYPFRIFEVPWFFAKTFIVDLCYYAILLFLFFKLGWHLYVFSKKANVYFMILLMLSIYAFNAWQTIFYPSIDKIAFLVRIILAIISAVYFKKRWYMFDTTRARTVVSSKEEES